MSAKTLSFSACASLVLCAGLGSLPSAVCAQTTSPFEQTLSDSVGNWQDFAIDVPAGTASLNVAITGVIGDADLYVRFGEKPTESAFDCRPYIDGSNETCTNANPQAGTWHISVNAYSDYSDVKLIATWAPADPAPPTVLSDWKAQILEKHNFYRAQHCAPALTWDDEIASSAQGWADGCVFSHAGVAGTGLGENLAGGIVGENAGAAVDMWYGEIKDYDFANPGFSSKTGHFTQVVWGASTKLGCGLAKCPGSIYGWPPEFGDALMYVCRYSPPGNFNNQFSANVKPLGAACE